MSKRQTAATTPQREITVSATEFKTTCLGLIKRLKQGKLRRVTITHRGTPVADLQGRPPKGKPKTLDEIFAHMRGTFRILPGVDLTGPVVDPDDWNAERGVLLNDK